MQKITIVMFERNIVKELRTWSEKVNRKPLILRGARQVGKTSIAIRIWSGKYSVDNVVANSKKSFRLINIPFYYINSIPLILSNI